MSKMKELAIDQLNQAKPTASQKRFQKAVNYLKSHNIDIYSRSDDFYREAMKIAAGLNN